MDKVIKKRIWMIKPLILLIFPVMIYLRTADMQMLASAALMLMMLGCLSSLLGYRWRKTAIILDGCLSCLMFMQYLVRYYANSYINIQMLTNLDSIDTISGKFYIYIPCVVLGVIGCFIPYRPAESQRGRRVAAVCLLASLILNFSVLRGSNVYYEYYKLYVQKTEMDVMSDRIAEYNASDIVSEFYKEKTDHYTSNNFSATEPNVILIFTEGLSQNVIEDERNITPNFRGLEEKAIYFDNYYNHTFATYMGLSGQFYSGYQQNNYDDNKLVSLQDIMKLNGYATYFINTEPENAEFSAYLEQMRFDEVITDRENLNGLSDSISDKDAYELLFEVALEKEAQKEPFLLGIYTLGTHTNMDSVDLKYGDEKNIVLNRFYNADYYFGEFLEKFHNSSLADNTILVFTTDHATYADNDYVNAFPEYERQFSMCDEIPLCIYYKGIEPQVIDANGRNSLDLTPTICDYLDLVGENYFLGSSLFSEDMGNVFDTIFQSGANYLSTKNAVISHIKTEELREFKELVSMYFAAKLFDESIYGEYLEMANVSCYQEDDRLIVEMSNMNDIKTLRIAVWSTNDGQDDIRWYSYRVRGKNMSCRIRLSDFEDVGEYSCHVYGYDKNEEEVFFQGQVVQIMKFK